MRSMIGPPCSHAVDGWRLSVHQQTQRVSIRVRRRLGILQDIMPVQGEDGLRKPTTRGLERQRRLSAYALRRLAKIQAVRRRHARRRMLKARSGYSALVSVVIVRAPKLLLFHGTGDTRQIFDTFIRRVDAALSDGRFVRIDFSKTERLFPCGLLLFLGWLDDWLEHFPGKLTCAYPADDLVEQMLQSAGVIERLGLSPRKVVNHNDVTRWHQFEGDDVDATPIEPFLEAVRAATNVEWQLGLGGCISEALTNVKKHAYSSGIPSHWWMFATVNLDQRQIFVAMHDHGDSIPGTLLAKPDLFDQVMLRKLRRGGDCELISAAAGGRTRTKLYYRGKGLPEMVEFTSRNATNALAIYSRRGYFQQRGSVDRKGTLVEPVKGTLVIWTLNFGAKP